MNASRREFMALTAASAAVLATGAAFASDAIGDGIADDTAAIQAVLDRGEAFEPKAGHERYRITRTLYIPDNGAGLHGCVFDCDNVDGPVVHCHPNAPAYSVTGCYFAFQAAGE